MAKDDFKPDDGINERIRPYILKAQEAGILAKEGPYAGIATVYHVPQGTMPWRGWIAVFDEEGKYLIQKVLSKYIHFHHFKEDGEGGIFENASVSDVAVLEPFWGLICWGLNEDGPEMPGWEERSAQRHKGQNKILLQAYGSDGHESRRRFIFRNHRNNEQSHCPYQNMIHDLNDAQLFQMSEFAQCFVEAGVKDGDEIEIIIRRTGKRPFGDRIWKLLSPHIYGPVDPDQPESGEDDVHPTR